MKAANDNVVTQDYIDFTNLPYYDDIVRSHLYDHVLKIVKVTTPATTEKWFVSDISSRRQVNFIWFIKFDFSFRTSEIERKRQSIVVL